MEIRLNSPVQSLEDLRQQGFQAIFIGVGAWQAQPLNLPGEELSGVIPGIDFLRMVNLGQKVEMGQDVTVVGGGSTAMDAARVAKRLGAKNVRVIYRRTRAEMPAQPEELIDAEEEGDRPGFLGQPGRAS